MFLLRKWGTRERERATRQQIGTFGTGRQFETDPTHLHWYSRHGLRALLGAHFTGIELGYAGGRRAWLSGALFAESLLWMCRPAMERE